MRALSTVLVATCALAAAMAPPSAVASEDVDDRSVLSVPAPIGADAEIRRGRDTRWTGRDTFGTVQRVSFPAVPAGATVTVLVRAINATEEVQRIRLRGPRTVPGFGVRYFLGDREVTAAVVNGTFRTRPLAIYETSAKLRVVIKRFDATAPGRTSLIRITAAGPYGQDDLVSAKVTASAVAIPCGRPVTQRTPCIPPPPPA